MAINISDSFHAAGIILCAAGAQAFGGQSGFAAAITDNGAGDFTLTLDNAIDQTAAVVQATPLFATFAAVTVERPADGTIRVRTWDAAGAALDNVSVCITVQRHSL